MATTVVDMIKRGLTPAGPKSRPVPRESGEGAIYTPEYLERVEGNRRGTDPDHWRRCVI